jgi:hypothetical protein
MSRGVGRGPAYADEQHLTKDKGAYRGFMGLSHDALTLCAEEESANGDSEENEAD